MYKLLLILLSVLMLACQENNNKLNEDVNPASEKSYALVIHGGAGTILKSEMTAELDKAYREALNTALDRGETILATGGEAIDAVTETIKFMEDSPLFNAGKGAVFTHEGTNEMDASIMRGDDQAAGAVGGLSTVKNPITAARAVMEKSAHVLLTGKGAEQFAREKGLVIVDPEYFFTERRWNALQQIIEEEKTALSETSEKAENKHGTVGCVALDLKGNIVAGTSTGGMTNKRYGRFGDVPLIGAGTYADNQWAGISCTGHGEYFIRFAVAHDVVSRMKYLKEDLKTATDQVINKTLAEKGGSGGLVALDNKGNIAMSFNSEGMYRAYAKSGERFVGIYKDESHKD